MAEASNRFAGLAGAFHHLILDDREGLARAGVEFPSNLFAEEHFLLMTAAAGVAVSFAMIASSAITSAV